MKNLWVWFFLCLFACQSVASFEEISLTDGEVSLHDQRHHLSESQPHDEHVHWCHHHHGEHNPPVLLSPIRWSYHNDALSAHKHAHDILPHRFITPLLRPPIMV